MRNPPIYLPLLVVSHKCTFQTRDKTIIIANILLIFVYINTQVSISNTIFIFYAKIDDKSTYILHISDKFYDFIWHYINKPYIE